MKRSVWRANFERRSDLIFFAPGVFLVVLALLAILAPRLILVALAGFLTLVGAVSCFIAWKFIQLRNRMREMMRQFEGKVIIQGVTIPQPSRDEISSLDSKKIILH